MRASGDPNELGAFLKARRAELTPNVVGIPESGALRRVSGLRREEVAQLASISVDYYTRLEQGRVPASGAVLATLVRALRLDEDQQAYVHQLAGRAAGQPRRRPTQRVRPAIRRLLEQLTDTPAIVLGRRMDILAWNRIACALYVDFEQLAPHERNYLRLLFTNPVMRNLHMDWEKAARTAVSTLRMEASHYVNDPELAALVGELSVQDHDFRTWWAARAVASTSFGTKRYRHATVGDLTLDCDTWDSPDGTEQRLMVLTAEPGTPTYQALRILSSWSAPEHPQAPSRTSQS